MIPQDRLLNYGSYPLCPEYIEWQITNQFPISNPPGIRVNFEREDNGNGDIRVIVIHGEKNTEGTDGYWGDSTGSAIWGLVTTEIFGAWEEITAKTRKSVYLILPDVARWDNLGAAGNIIQGAPFIDVIFQSLRL